MKPAAAQTAGSPATAQTAGSPAASPGIAFENADIGYGGHAVVRGVDLEVRRGELLGLVGPNGAGKSTLLRAVTGTAQLLAGSVRIAGLALDGLEPRHRARLVGVVPQSLPEPFAFGAREFVAMGRYPHLGRFGRPTDDDLRTIEEVMRLTDTERLGDMRVDTLSGGDLQRLTLAQALAQRPEILLLDEPVSHLDLNHRLQVLDLVRSLAEDGLAVLGVFHELELAARYSDRLAVVSDGGVPLVGTPSEVLTPATLREVFAVRAVIGTDPVTGTVAVTPVLREQVAVATDGPEVLVIGGSGASARILRELAVAGFRVHAGALSVGDIDCSVAETLGASLVRLPAFGEVDAAAEEAVAAAARAAAAVLVSGVPFGRTNLGNLRAVSHAECPVILVGEMSPERDFTGGEAAAIWTGLVDAGAIVVRDQAEALDAIRRLGRS